MGSIFETNERSPFMRHGLRNPFLSLWLSGANHVMNTGKGLVLAEARQQQGAAATQAWRNLWFGKRPGR